MSSARLEIVTDEPAVAPRMSRALPAALYGMVNATAFEEFCDKLDELFDQLYANNAAARSDFGGCMAPSGFGYCYLSFLRQRPFLSQETNYQ